jgi:hypothetical protein
LINFATAILVLACAGPKPSLTLAQRAEPRLISDSPHLDAALTESAFRSAGARERSSTPACIGNTCQPRVSIPVPGFEPRIDVRGKGAEFAASALERMDAGLLATGARWIAASGLRLEVQPKRGDEYLPARSKLRARQATVMFSWRLDAWNGPLFALAPAR